jgi:hypothetical protein
MKAETVLPLWFALAQSQPLHHPPLRLSCCYILNVQESGKKAEDFICGRYTGDEQQSESILVSNPANCMHVHSMAVVKASQVGWEMPYLLLCCAVCSPTSIPNSASTATHVSSSELQTCHCFSASAAMHVSSSELQTCRCLLVATVCRRI